MFSATLKLAKTSSNFPHTNLLKIRRLTPSGASSFLTSLLPRFCSCLNIVPQRPQDNKLADRKREVVRFYWNSIRKRFQSNDPIGKSASNKTSKPAKRITNNKMAEGRFWETTSTSTSSTDEGEEIIVMSYNILAQHLLNAHQCLYQKHIRRHLAWDHRLNLIVQHIESISPHVLCLQEVQSCHLPEMSKRLARLGLDQHIFKKRTSQEYRDGCAVFYRSDCLHLIDFHRVEFFQPKVTLLDRANVAVLTKFQSNSNPDIVFCVCTTHLLYNPKREDVRLAQIQVLLAEIDRFSYLNKRTKSGRLMYAPVILTGDFNTQPSTASFQLITTGKLDYHELSGNRLEASNWNSNKLYGKHLLPTSVGITDACQHITFAKFNSTDSTWLFNSGDSKVLQELPDDQHVNDMPFSTGTLRHKLSLSSVYPNVNTATTFHDKWITVDYIFYSKRYVSTSNSFVDGTLRLLDRYSLPSIEACCKMFRIPDEQHGSDHISLAAKFLVLPTVGHRD